MGALIADMVCLCIRLSKEDCVELQKKILIKTNESLSQSIVSVPYDKNL